MGCFDMAIRRAIVRRPFTSRYRAICKYHRVGGRYVPCADLRRRLPGIDDFEQQAPRDKPEQHGDQVVNETRHNGPAPLHQTAIARFRDVVRRFGQQAWRHAAIADAGTRSKLGRYRARAQHSDLDPARRKLTVQRFGEGQHIGFGGVVHGHARSRQEPGHRTDIEKPAAMAGKTIDKGNRQFGQCAHVEIDHL